MFFLVFPLNSHVPFCQISYFSCAIIIVSAPSSCFDFAVPMRKVSRAGISVPFTTHQMIPCTLKRIGLTGRSATLDRSLGRSQTIITVMLQKCMYRGGQRSLEMERRSRSCSMRKIGAALPLNIFKMSGAVAPALGDGTAATLPLFLNKNHYISCKN